MKTLSNIELAVVGNNADNAVKEFATLFDQSFGCSVKVLSDQKKTASGVKAVDPIALTTLFLAIPPAILAASDLIKRMKSKENAQTLIQLSKDIEKKHEVSIHIKTPDGKLISVQTSDPSTLIDIVSCK
ncbi:hypothetical protein MHK_004569 [Candidatus Magnetomorum sp. HK-1]|nr:hypothetical protein MHK_004569 [Candidatus Magnetomorum sp. HK-1]